MNHRYSVALLAMAFTATGYAAHISIMQTHREDLSGQTKKLAVAARNLEDTVHRNPAGPGEEEAARAVAAFHNETESFARIAGAWRSDDQVNDEFERLVAAWVKMKHTFPALKADSLTQDAFKRVEHEWEETHRASGGSGRKYEKIQEKKYEEPASSK